MNCLEENRSHYYRDIEDTNDPIVDALIELREDVDRIDGEVETLTPQVELQAGLIAEVREDLTDLEESTSEKFNQVDDRLDTIEAKLINRKFIFIGDSYGAAQGSWANKLLSSPYNLSGVNACVSGGGAYNVEHPENTYYSQLVDAAEDIEDKESITDIVVCGGFNDMYPSTDMELNKTNIKTAFAELASYIRQTFPNATMRVGMIGNFRPGASWTPYTWPAHYRENLACVLEAYQQGALENGGAYLNNVEFVLRYLPYISNDNVHPSAGGQTALAAHIYNTLINGATDVSYTHRVANGGNADLGITWDFTRVASNETMSNGTSTFEMFKGVEGPDYDYWITCYCPTGFTLGATFPSWILYAEEGSFCGQGYYQSLIGNTTCKYKVSGDNNVHYAPVNIYAQQSTTSGENKTWFGFQQVGVGYSENVVEFSIMPFKVTVNSLGA